MAATATKSAPKKTANHTIGRPADSNELRYMIRHTAKQYSKETGAGSWQVAAATSGLTVQEWMRKTLDAEANKATHVPQLKR